MLKVGDRLPAGSLQEFIEVETEGCAIGPNSFDIEKATAGKTIVIFGLPGAFTPTCHRNHLPGFVENALAIKGKGIDMIAVTAVFVFHEPFGRARAIAFPLIGAALVLYTASLLRRARAAALADAG